MPQSKPRQATAEARALLRAAGNDSKTVEVLLRYPDSPISSICFHAQQYLEKVMKAVLVSNGMIFRRTHDLEELADLLAQIDILPPLTKEKLKQLNPFAVITRYENIEITSIDTQTIAGMMENASAWVAVQLYV